MEKIEPLKTLTKCPRCNHIFDPVEDTDHKFIPESEYNKARTDEEAWEKHED